MERDSPSSGCGSSKGAPGGRSLGGRTGGGRWSPRPRPSSDAPSAPRLPPNPTLRAPPGSASASRVSRLRQPPKDPSRSLASPTTTEPSGSPAAAQRPGKRRHAYLAASVRAARAARAAAEGGAAGGAGPEGGAAQHPQRVAVEPAAPPADWPGAGAGPQVQTAGGAWRSGRGPRSRRGGERAGPAPQPGAARGQLWGVGPRGARCSGTPKGLLGPRLSLRWSKPGTQVVLAAVAVGRPDPRPEPRASGRRSGASAHTPRRPGS